MRRLLFVLGLALVVWLPLSWHCGFGITFPSPGDWTSLISSKGVVAFMHVPEIQGRGSRRGWEHWEVWTFSGSWRWPWISHHDAVLPRATVEKSYYFGFNAIRIPLWLLAFLCLAWPVTSFIIARRRGKGRGFEVEAKPGAAVPPPES